MAGEAIVQTLYPNHYSIRPRCRQDYAAFYADELHFRQSMRYPPSVALINVIVKGKSRAEPWRMPARLPQHCVCPESTGTGFSAPRPRLLAG
jgi:primosomal protein N' (replication factor Y)